MGADQRRFDFLHLRVNCCDPLVVLLAVVDVDSAEEHHRKLGPAMPSRQRLRSMASTTNALGRHKSSWAFGPPRLRRPSR